MASKKFSSAKYGDTTIIYVKSSIDIQRYFIGDMLREKGHLMPPEKYKNWKELHDTLLLATKVLQDMHTVRNQSLIFAYNLSEENEKLKYQVSELLSR